MSRSGKRGLSPSAWVGLGLVLTFLLVALIGPLVAPHSPDDLDMLHSFASPSGAHWLGTDQNGRDILSMLLHGARMALIISGSVVAICATTGVALGVIAGYYRGWVDELIMRVVDILMAFPGILLNIAIVATVARPGVGMVVLALALNGWVGYARVARGQVLRVRELEYVAAARAIGARPRRIMWRHIVPNILSPILVQISFAFAGVVLVEASLSFLGLGPQVPYTWGAMLSQGATFFFKSQSLALIPGLAIMWVVLGANLLGDGLRDRFDPRRRARAA